MNRFLPFLLLLVLTARADPPGQPGPILVAGENDAAWKPLFTALAGKGAIVSQFTERRWFSIRKKPIELAGEMRLAPGHGLSLHYLPPQESTMIVDEHGLLLRDAGGQAHEVPPDPRAGAVIASLLPILRFDQADLMKTFVVHAAREGDDWRLDFVPRDAALGRLLGSVIVIGAGDAIQWLEFHRTATQRVEIAIRDTRTGVTFTPADLQRYFR